MDVDVDAEPKAAIMHATYRALCSKGYADLTMQDIADEAPVSKGALHYHYDSKRGLFEAFQRSITEHFFARINTADDPDTAPRKRLSIVLDSALSPAETDDLTNIQRVLLELKAQAPHEPVIRAQVDEWDARLRELLAEIIKAGVDSGDFQIDTDPETVARFIVTVLSGVQTRQVSVGQSTETGRKLLETYIEEWLAAAEANDR